MNEWNEKMEKLLFLKERYLYYKIIFNNSIYVHLKI